MSIEVRLLGPGEAAVLACVASQVFDNPVNPGWARAFLSAPHHHLAVALDGPTVVGMASAVDYLHPDKPVQLWVNEVGVAPSHHRRGIGRRLIEALQALARELGCEEVWVATEHDNLAAQKLYERTGGQPERVVMYSFDIDEPG